MAKYPMHKNVGTLDSFCWGLVRLNTIPSCRIVMQQLLIMCASFEARYIPWPYSPPSKMAELFSKMALPAMLTSDDSAKMAPAGTIVNTVGRCWKLFPYFSISFVWLKDAWCDRGAPLFLEVSQAGILRPPAKNELEKKQNATR